MTVSFYIDRNKSKRPEKLIICYIWGVLPRKHMYLNTGLRINPIYWDKNKQQAKRGYIGYPEFNKCLQDFKKRVELAYLRAKAENPDADCYQIETAIKRAFNTQTADFFESFNEFIEVNTHYSVAMIKKYRSLIRHLQDFEKAKKLKITLTGVNQLLFDKLIAYFQTEKKLTNNTTSKYIKLIKTFLNWCVERKGLKNTDYKKVKTKHDKVDIIALTEKELKQLYEYDFYSETLKQVRDVFCFGCFTGQRFSDIRNLKRADIKGRKWYLRVQKTREINEIYLNDYALSILQRYAGNERPLPVMSNQKTNQCLKEACRIAGIDDIVTITRYRGAERIEKQQPKYNLITTHVARKTFITLSLQKGMRREVVKKISGHYTNESFEKYVSITNSEQTKAMEKYWSKN